MFIFIIIFFISSCDTSKKDFQQAEDTATKEAYEKFIHDHPESSLIEIANSRIKEIDSWVITNESKTIRLYKEHIKLFPNGLFISDANCKIQMIKDYEETKSTDIVKSYQSFLEKHPTSIFSYSIEKRLKELKDADKEFQLIEKVINTELLKNYLTKFYDTGYIKLLKERLDKRSVERYDILLSENNTKILNIYLKEFEGTEGFKLMRSRLDKMALEEFQTIQDKTSIDILKTYISKYPNTKQANTIQVKLDELILSQTEKKILNKKKYKRLPKTYEDLNKYIDKNITANNIKLAKQALEDILIEKLKISNHAHLFKLPQYYVKNRFKYDGHRYRYSICTLSKKETLKGQLNSRNASIQTNGTIILRASQGELKLFTEYPDDSIPYYDPTIPYDDPSHIKNSMYSFSSFGGFNYSKNFGATMLTGSTHSSPMEAYNDIVWRFHGNVKLGKNYIVYGEPNDPLSFYLMKFVGVVYLYGKGKVIKDGKTIFSKQATHGILTIRSNVYKDKVYVNNEVYGSTKVDIKLPFGKHNLRVEKKGYIPYEQNINFQDSTTIKVKLHRN